MPPISSSIIAQVQHLIIKVGTVTGHLALHCYLMDPSQLQTGHEVRIASRDGKFKASTPGLAPGYLQTNLIVLPSKFANDFRLLCQRNPVPCPLLAESSTIGDFSTLKSHIAGVSGEEFAASLDVRSDAPAYTVYVDGELQEQHLDEVRSYWTSDHVAFLIGCSFSFENALAEAGLPPRHMLQKRNVPMYRTNIPLCPAGVFSRGTVVVSMRFYKQSQIEKVRAVTRPYVVTHGEPIAWGWDAMSSLGICSLNKPDWGDQPLALNDRELSRVVGDDDHDHDEDCDIPVFWGCGVTPQEAVMKANLPGVVIGHQPGHMLVLDLKEDRLL
jgi:uncharacterized protein YcsI (UPF0317 family)